MHLRGKGPRIEVASHFYDRYEQALGALRAELLQQEGDQRKAHASALWLLNELLFLCFLQRRSWPDGVPNFLTRLWHLYLHSQRDGDSFVSVWLDPLMARARGSCASPDSPDLQKIPGSLHEALDRVPALGSGLFLRTQWYEPGPRVVSDACFKEVLGFLDAYDYTLKDGARPEQEGAVDPGMVGSAYERLVNTSEVGGRRVHSGIYFTPRAEIDLMCRLFLVE